MKRIYLDHSATTPIDKSVLKAMLPYLSDNFGNPSSVHSFGQEARAAVDNARHQIAGFLNCKSTEVIFTSGGSESDNLAIRGVINQTLKQVQNDKKIPHIVTSAFEHHAVLETIKELEAEGKIEATYIKPNCDGIIKVEKVEKAIKENTVLVSIMYVNNEIGTAQPIREIGKMIERINRKRLIENGNLYGKKKKEIGNKAIIQSQISLPADASRQAMQAGKPISNFHQLLSKIYFHTDAVQATEYFPMDVDYLHVDLLTLSAHKIYGPKGTGLLYVRTGVPIKHQIVGGGQEYKKRAGTENVAGIVGFAKAVEMAKKSKIKNQKSIRLGSAQPRLIKPKVEILRNKLIDGILKKIPNSFLNGSKEFRSPVNVNISFINAEGEAILLNLDMEGIAASTGSACTSGSLEPSHVLLSMGLSPKECHGSIRFTLGRSTTETEIDKVLKVLPAIIKKLRKMSPFS